MLGCTEQLISEYVDGDLSPALARNVEQHLWVCQRCRAIFLDFRTLVAVTRALAAQRFRRQGTWRDVPGLRDPFGPPWTGRVVS